MLDTPVKTVESTDAATEGQNLNSDTANASSNAQTPTPDSDVPNQEKTLTQSEVNAIVARETKKARDAAIKEKEIADAQKASEEQGQFKPLYEAEKERVKNLATERDGLRELADSQVESTIKDWPEEFKQLVPEKGEDNALERWREVQKLSKAVALVQAKKPEAPDLDATKRGGSNQIVTEEEAANIAALYGIKKG